MMFKATQHKDLIIVEKDKEYQGENFRACVGCHYLRKGNTPPWREEGSICDQNSLDMGRCFDAMMLRGDVSNSNFLWMIWATKTGDNQQS